MHAKATDCNWQSLNAHYLPFTYLPAAAIENQFLSLFMNSLYSPNFHRESSLAPLIDCENTIIRLIKRVAARSMKRNLTDEQILVMQKIFIILLGILTKYMIRV